MEQSWEGLGVLGPHGFIRASQDPGARMYVEQWVRRQEANAPALQPVARGNSGDSRRRDSLGLCASCLGLVGSSKLGSGRGLVH